MAHMIQFSMRCSDPDIFQIEINVSAAGHKWVYWAIDIVGARRDISPAIGGAATAQLVSLDVDRAPASLESQNQVENLATAHPTVIQLDSWDVSLIPSVDSLVFPYSSTSLTVPWIFDSFLSVISSINYGMWRKFNWVQKFILFLKCLDYGLFLA